MLQDCRGLPTTAANAEAVAAYDRTVDSFLRFGQDIPQGLQATFEADPDMILAHCFKGAIFLLRGFGSLVPRARETAAALAGRIGQANDRERGHIAAFAAWCRGDLAGAADIWDGILLDAPRDIMALKLGHYARLYLGGGAAMRDSVARTMHAWEEAVPGYGYVLGMHAFALEENGDYAAAERAGRRAIELQPHDGWATHAVAHVMEMQERRREGIDWLTGLQPHWIGENNFRLHLWWHCALMHLSLDDTKAVLELYDRALWDPGSDEYLDLCNDVSLLVRLELDGVDVGERWQPLAEKIRGRTGEHILAFIDFHYMLALAAAGLGSEAVGMLDSLRDYAKSEQGTNPEVTLRIGVALCEGLLAHRQGAHGRAVDRLWPLRYELYRIGGSHAQRDLVAMILIDAAIKAERLPLARALLAERAALKPKDPWTWRAYAGVLERLGDASGAVKASRLARSGIVG
jgi:tetratricopeptide (TPR) repeat protein